MLGFVGDCSCLCVCTRYDCLGFRTVIVLLVISCLVPLLKNVNNHHAAFWSASPSPQENPYNISLGLPNEPLGSCRNRIGEPMTYTVWEQYHLSRNERLPAPQTVSDAWSEIGCVLFKPDMSTCNSMWKQNFDGCHLPLKRGGSELYLSTCSTLKPVADPSWLKNRKWPPLPIWVHTDDMSLFPCSCPFHNGPFRINCYILVKTRLNWE
jgi:hypothetical protein